MPAISVEFRDVNVADTIALLDHWIEAMAKLWAAGRMRSVLETPEGLAAIEVLERNLRTAAQQLDQAYAAGLKRTTVRTELPPEFGMAGIAMVETLHAMVSDPRTMNSVDAEPLTVPERELGESLIRATKAAIAAAP